LEARIDIGSVWTSEAESKRNCNIEFEDEQSPDPEYRFDMVRSLVSDCKVGESMSAYDSDNTAESAGNLEDGHSTDSEDEPEE
jgi:hypothetical protein